MGDEVVRVFVGPDQREFSLHKKLLCTASPYFRDRLDVTPSNLSSSPTTTTTTATTSSSPSTGAVLWLADESPEMFELFVLWLYQRRAFRLFVGAAVSSATHGTPFLEFPNLQNDLCRRTLHWNLVRLHLFAAMAGIPALQDVAMDALQDLYLRCDWEVSPRFVAFLYGECDPDRSVRLRKWVVAMVAWAMYGGETGLSLAGKFQTLFDAHPALWDDYVKHLDKMNESRADVRVKNPQLRLPGNRLRAEERFLGFRTCSFHSHRAAVGEGSCPLAVGTFRTTKSPWRRAKEEMESDDSDDCERGILSPVSHSRWDTYLDSR